MDDIVRRAIAEDEIAKRDFDNWQYQRQRQQRERQEREQRQAAHAVEQRNVRAWLAQPIDDDRVVAVNSGTGNDEGWNRWAQAMEANEIATEVNNQIVDDLDKFHAELEARFERRRVHFEQRDTDLGSRIDELESRLAELEARVADLEGSGEQQKVVPLLTFKGGRDAAA